MVAVVPPVVAVAASVVIAVAVAVAEVHTEYFFDATMI